MVVITVLLLVELDKGQLERTTNTQTLSVPDAISGESRQEKALISQHSREVGGGE